MIKFVGGPWDGKVTANDFGDDTMMIHRGHSALHLYDRVAIDRFEYWACLTDDFGEESSFE